jgi:hypothetical protein
LNYVALDVKLFIFVAKFDHPPGLGEEITAPIVGASETTRTPTNATDKAIAIIVPFFIFFTSFQAA